MQHDMGHLIECLFPFPYTCMHLCARMQAKSVGNSGLVDKLEADARLMSYQAEVAQRLEVGDGAPVGRGVL